MSEARPETRAGPGSTGSEPQLEAFITEVRELFATLAKALRAYQLYESNNPVYQRFVQSLADAFRRLWEHQSQLTVTVEESRLLVDSDEVYTSESRSDSLAFMLFRDGIREVTFLPGIEDQELEALLGVLHHARHVATHGDDLLNILWEAQLSCLLYQNVDMLAEGVEIPEPGSGASAERLRSVLEEEEEEDEDEDEDEDAAAKTDTASVVNQEGFNPTLYSLDPREMELLQREIELEMERDLRTDVLAALFDRLEEADRPECQSETLEALRTLLPNLLSRGALTSAAQILAELRALEARAGVLDEQRRGEVTVLVDEVSTSETIQELVRALEDGSISPEPRQLSEFLTHLRAEALGPLLRASEAVASRELQPVLQEAVKGIAGSHRPSLVKLLDDDDPLVVAGAAHLVGRLHVQEATPALQHLLAHSEVAVRLAAVEAALALRASTAAGPLQEALDDPEREVRIAAARALGRLRYRPAAARFRSAVTGREIRSADLTEKIAFFEGYGELGDEKAVTILDRMLNGKGLLGRREPTEIRACAALALGRVGTAEARAALELATTDEEAVVKSAVKRALRAATEGEA